MTLLGHDNWDRDQPAEDRIRAQLVADDAAWHAFNAMERAIGGVRAAMEDPNTSPIWLDRLRTVSLQAGALAIGREAC